MIAVIGILAALVSPSEYRIPLEVYRNVEASNLRSIGQAMLADAATHHNGYQLSSGLPDVYALAAHLARDGMMNDSKLWYSKIDRNYPAPIEPPAILIPAAEVGGDPTINPKFQAAPLAFAVALFPAGTNLKPLPGNTPLAWTRGLQPDGTWSKRLGTYGDWGGHIVFLNGLTKTFKGSVKGGLVKFGTTQPTSDIREALPPGTRISEYKPGI